MGKATKKNNCEPKKKTLKTLKNKTDLEQSGGALEELKNVFIEDIKDWQKDDHKIYFNDEQAVDAFVAKYKIKKPELSDPLNHEKILPILDVVIQPDLFIWGANADNHSKPFNAPLGGDGQAGKFAPYTHDGKPASHPNYLGIITTQYDGLSTHDQVLADINTKFNYLETYVTNGGKVHIPRDHLLYDESVAKAEKAVEQLKKTRKDKLEEEQIKETEKMINNLTDSIVTIQMGLGAGLAKDQQDSAEHWNIQQDLLYYRVAKLCVLTLQDKLDHIDDFLSIYNYNFLPQIIISSIKTQVKTEAFKKKLFSAVLILPKKPDDETITRDIKQHLLFRHPVHFGPDDKWNWIKELNFMSIFGYSKKLVYLFDANVRGKLRLPSSTISELKLSSNDNTTCPGDTRLQHLWYGILGWTDWVHKENKIDDYERFRPTKDGAYILHTWGVNLENDRTPHYKFCYSSNIHEKPQPKALTFGDFNEINYKRLLNNTLGVIQNAITYLTLKEQDKIIQVRITKLGFGAWKEMIPDDKKISLLEYYKEKLLSMQKDNKVVITFLDYDKGSSETSTSTGWKHNAPEDNHTDPFGKYIDNDNDVLLLVNAWDDASFIGNGGLLDNTLDGWMVTGAINNPGINGKPLGHYAQNYSYFHNVFFQPQLLNETNWKWGEGKVEEGKKEEEVEKVEEVEEVEKVEKVEKVEEGKKVEEVKLNPLKRAFEGLVDMFGNLEVKLGESDEKKAGEEEIKKDSPRNKSLNLYERLFQEFNKDKHRDDHGSIQRADRNKNKVLIINKLLNKKEEETINELFQIAKKIKPTDSISKALITALDNMDVAEEAVVEANAAAKSYHDALAAARAAHDKALEDKKQEEAERLRNQIVALNEQFKASDAGKKLRAAEDAEKINISKFNSSFNAWSDSIKQQIKEVVEDLLDREPENQMVIDLANEFNIESQIKMLAREQAEMKMKHREEIKRIASGSIAGSIDDVWFDIEKPRYKNLTDYYDILISQAREMNMPEYKKKIKDQDIQLEAELEELRKKHNSTDIDKAIAEAIAEAMDVMIKIGKKIKAKILKTMETIENYDQTKLEQLNKTIKAKTDIFDKSTQEIIAISKVMIKRIRDYNQSSFNDDEEYLNIENMKTMIEILTIKMNANEITTSEAKKVVTALQKVFKVSENVKEPKNLENTIINTQIFAVAIAKGFTNYENYDRILHKYVILDQHGIEMNNYTKLDSDILAYKKLSNDEEKKKMYSSLRSRKDEFTDLDYYSEFNKPIKIAAEEVAEQQVIIIDLVKDKDLKVEKTPQAVKQLFTISQSIDTEPIQEALNDLVKAFHFANVAQSALFAARAANDVNAGQHAERVHELDVVAHQKYYVWEALIKKKVIEIANLETWTTDSAKKIIAALLFAFSINQTDVSNYEQFIVPSAEEEPADAEAEAERLAAAEAERLAAAEAERLAAAEAERVTKEADTKYYQNLSEAIARGFNTYEEMNIYKDVNKIYSGYEYFNAYTHIKEDNTIEKITNESFIEKLTNDIETITYDIKAVERGIISKPPEYLATLNAKLIMLETKKLFAVNQISSEDDMYEKLSSSPNVISVFEFANFMGVKARNFDEDIKINLPMNADQLAGLQLTATKQAIKDATNSKWEGEWVTIIVAALLSSFKIDLATISNHESYKKFIPKQKTQEEYKRDAFAVARGFFTLNEMESILEIVEKKGEKFIQKYPNIKNYYDTIPIYVETTKDTEIDREIKILTEILVRLNTALEPSIDKEMIHAKIEMVTARHNILNDVLTAKKEKKESTDKIRNAAIQKAFNDKIKATEIKNTILIAREIQNVALNAKKEIIEDALTQMNGKQDGILKNSIIVGFKNALQLDDQKQQAKIDPAEERPAEVKPAGNPGIVNPNGNQKKKVLQVQQPAGNPDENQKKKGLQVQELAGNPGIVNPNGNQKKKVLQVQQPAGNPDENQKKEAPPALGIPQPQTQPQTQSPDQQNTHAILSTIYQEETSSSYMFYIPIVGILIAISSVLLIK